MMSHPPIASHFLQTETLCQGWNAVESEAALDIEVVARQLRGGGMSTPPVFIYYCPLQELPTTLRLSNDLLAK